MESYKNKSRIITILTTCLIAILTYIASMNPDQLAQTLGIYGSYASVIIVICASIINQISEEKRVTRAEDIIEEDYTKLGYPRITEDDNEETNTTNDNIEPTITDINLTTETEPETLEPVGDDEQ